MYQTVRDLTWSQFSRDNETGKGKKKPKSKKKRKAKVEEEGEGEGEKEKGEDGDDEEEEEGEKEKEEDGDDEEKEEGERKRKDDEEGEGKRKEEESVDPEAKRLRFNEDEGGNVHTFHDSLVCMPKNLRKRLNTELVVDGGEGGNMGTKRMRQVMVKFIKKLSPNEIYDMFSLFQELAK